MPSPLSNNTRQTTPGPGHSIDKDTLLAATKKAARALLDRQHPDGYWCFELEADCTIPAEYILMMHFMDEIDTDLQSKLANYLRSKQQAEGGWPLYYRGAFNMSCSVKAYYALKLAGDDPNASHMQKAKELILAHGGAARSNVFTRIALAFFGQVPWRAIPFIPVEILLLPEWFPFHLSKISYWSRTVLVPLAILCSLRAKAKNPTGVHVQELFTVPPKKEKGYFPIRSRKNWVLLKMERTSRYFAWAIPGRIRAKAMKYAKEWFIERLNGENGLGAIFPAMVNAHEALALLGYEKNHPFREGTGWALRRLLVDQGEMAYCQPCMSPVWDTGLAMLALLELRDEEVTGALKAASDWLVKRQVTDEPGDWRDAKPDLPGGGWAFQFENPHYPDLDDTAVVAWAMYDLTMRGHGSPAYRNAMEKATRWIAGMQSRNGGFAAFDADNTNYLLNEIPFADHGALLDPPSSDVTARCVTLLARYDREKYASEIKQALDYLAREQTSCGAWFGRWGTNYIYGTWSVLTALETAGVDPEHPMIRRAVTWLLLKQNLDGGWGETNDSYEDVRLAGEGPRSCAFQTAWALLGLMIGGEIDSEAVEEGIGYLLRHQETDGLWSDPEFTAPGFPRVFYLKYHGYDKFFPLWALARYFSSAGGEKR
ncbi:MAG: squalene-hopene/tetraprenyl-beta-curcumene cyclase [Candidatus Kentron sp. G]|nr:MAG: squalene-hopene/tetraprenyl-beta-curcumene cyclase [Candidatus Kentron sp. G]VFM98325.1 MAG: squalene-hopene/tetraprenyl-beta-curcumene cyclase [Candidatus Kentron sp. G]VFN00498.1 MAG: squalene-hopene/tetraprenyl-beta-curcumene cyclase [Candidatus Kentron sp. G]